MTVKMKKLREQLLATGSFRPYTLPNWVQFGTWDIWAFLGDDINRPCKTPCIGLGGGSVHGDAWQHMVPVNNVEEAVATATALLLEGKVKHYPESD